MSTKEQQAAAYVAGYQAAYYGKPRAPIMSKDMGEILKEVSGPVGSAVAVLTAFAKGYQDRCDEEAEMALAD